jgi:hypothetical protein
MTAQINTKAQIGDANKTELPRYETPRIQAMTEKEILNSFQITQSMGVWWAVPTC